MDHEFSGPAPLGEHWNLILPRRCSEQLQGDILTSDKKKKKKKVTNDKFPLFMFPQKVAWTFWCSASNGLPSGEISPGAARTDPLQPHTGSSPQPHNTRMQQPRDPSGNSK